MKGDDPKNPKGVEEIGEASASSTIFAAGVHKVGQFKKSFSSVVAMSSLSLQACAVAPKEAEQIQPMDKKKSEDMFDKGLSPHETADEDTILYNAERAKVEELFQESRNLEKLANKCLDPGGARAKELLAEAARIEEIAYKRREDACDKFFESKNRNHIGILDMAVDLLGYEPDEAINFLMKLMYHCAYLPATRSLEIVTKFCKPETVERVYSFLQGESTSKDCIKEGCATIAFQGGRNNFKFVTERAFKELLFEQMKGNAQTLEEDIQNLKNILFDHKKRSQLVAIFYQKIKKEEKEAKDNKDPGFEYLLGNSFKCETYRQSSKKFELLRKELLEAASSEKNKIKAEKWETEAKMAGVISSMETEFALLNIFKFRNKELKNLLKFEVSINLHLFQWDEAVLVSQKHVYHCVHIPAIKSLKIITGWGLHSPSGFSLVKQKVDEFIQNEGMEIRRREPGKSKDNPGCFWFECSGRLKFEFLLKPEFQKLIDDELISSTGLVGKLLKIKKLA